MLPDRKSCPIARVLTIDLARNGLRQLPLLLNASALRSLASACFAGRPFRATHVTWIRYNPTQDWMVRPHPSHCRARRCVVGSL
jgi:hypothetical protein